MNSDIQQQIECNEKCIAIITKHFNENMDLSTKKILERVIERLNKKIDLLRGRED